MLQAVLLDLDNTLVIFDEPGFYSRYFKALEPCMQDLMLPDTLRLGIMKGINSLQTQPGRVSNLDYFLDHFTAATGCTWSKTALWERFDQFYDRHYATIPIQATVAENLDLVMTFLKSRKLPLALATNPIFPRKAQLIRLAWTGLKPADFRLITSIENMHHAKPQTDYYLDICRQLQVPPEACLMVGNDRANDMAASAAGLKTYMTTDADPIDYSTMSKGKNRPPRPPKPVFKADFKGPLAELPQTVAALMKLSG